MGHDTSIIANLNNIIEQIADKYAHEIRAPLARLQGLISLFLSGPKDKRVIKHMLSVSSELDDLLKAVATKTDVAYRTLGDQNNDLED